MHIEIVGNYRIGIEPWRLIEIRQTGGEAIDFDGIALPIPGFDRSYWQCPWEECLLSSDVARADYHACFFLYVSSDEALITPAAPIRLPPVTDRPAHLDFMRFEEP
jgi:hypothetical protein